MGAVDRAAVALAALRAAEQRTGARRVRLPSPAPDAHPPQRPSLTVPTQLATALPHGLPRGSVTQVTGSAALVLTLLAHAGRSHTDLGAEPWLAVVGCPSLGMVAAAQMGVPLDRLILVPDAAAQAPAVLAALIDGVDLVVVGKAALLEADRRRLAARARDRGTAIVATTPWPGARTVLHVAGTRWRGLGSGTGRLTHCEAIVDSKDRSGATLLRARVDLMSPINELREAAAQTAPIPTATPAQTITPAPVPAPVPVQPTLRLVG